MPRILERFGMAFSQPARECCDSMLVLRQFWVSMFYVEPLWLNREQRLRRRPGRVGNEWRSVVVLIVGLRHLGD